LIVDSVTKGIIFSSICTIKRSAVGLRLHPLGIKLRTLPQTPYLDLRGGATELTKEKGKEGKGTGGEGKGHSHFCAHISPLLIPTTFKNNSIK